MTNAERFRQSYKARPNAPICRVDLQPAEEDLDRHIYVTDARGIGVFDSDGRSEGEGFLAA